MHSDIPTFTGYAHPGGKFDLDFPAQVKAWTKRLAGTTGAALEIRITEAGQEKSRKQEKGFHAMVSPWAKDRGWRLDALKQFLLKEIFGTHTFVDPRTGEELQLLAEPHTSALTRRQYAELIERTMEIAAEDGVYLMAPDEYRKAKEAEAKRKQRARVRQDEAAARKDRPGAAP